jgi:hypothetical protein
MNIRQQNYKKNRILGMNKYNAAIAAGYSHNYSKNCRPEKVVKDGIIDALERAGLTDKQLAGIAVAGTQATKVISANITYGDADEKTNDFIEVPDWQSRHKFFESCIKLKGHLQEVGNTLIDASTKVLNIYHSNGAQTGDSLLTRIRNAEKGN